jgi:hypothetical protein
MRWETPHEQRLKALWTLAFFLLANLIAMLADIFAK